jgi:hypothetical protein
VFVEEVDKSGFYYDPKAEPKDTWMFVQVEFRAADKNKSDGYYKRWTNGQLLSPKMETQMFPTRNDKFDAPIKVIYPMHQVAANINDWKPALDKKTASVTVTDIYVDNYVPSKDQPLRAPGATAVPRVIVSDAPKIADSKIFQVLPTTAWKDGKIEAKIELPRFKSGDTAYVRVLNEYNKWSDPLPVRVGGTR